MSIIQQLTFTIENTKCRASIPWLLLTLIAGFWKFQARLCVEIQTEIDNRGDPLIFSSIMSGEISALASSVRSTVCVSDASSACALCADILGQVFKF